jgi:nucleotide-binding universal stress UspA family protein
LHVDKTNDPDSVNQKMEVLSAYFSDKHPKIKINFEVLCSEDFLDCINNYVESYHIDLVAVVHRRKGFLKRLFRKDHTRELLFHSSVPLYIFPGVRG